MKTELTDHQLLRYSRQILLPQVDVNGQLAICNSKVLVVGAGGLGSPVAMYLVAAGVGAITIVDDDVVDLTNLQRQIMHGEASVGQLKVESAQQSLNTINGEVKVNGINERLTEHNIDSLVGINDVVVDCSDNFTTRTLINTACVKNKTPLISGAAIRLEGQLTVFDSRNPQSPCYQCLYDIAGEQNLTCSESGVLGPVVGVIGAAQALETLKMIANFGETLMGRVQLYDAASGRWREFKLLRDSTCAVCAQR